MRFNTKRQLFILVIAVLIISCGGSTEKTVKQTISPKAILESIEIAGINKVSEGETYVGESLYEYINGGAEVWHTYEFVEVSTVDYKAGDVEIVADVYEFDNPINAYGMYSILRPDEVETINIGVQGYSSQTNFDFVKGKYIVRILSYDSTPEAITAMDDLARAIETGITGTTSLPALFAKFPQANKKPNSEKITAESYLGQAWLVNVFTVDYDFDNENVQLFLIDDKTGEIFSNWIANSDIDADAMKSIKDLPYETGKMIILKDSYYGQVLAGLKNGKIAGVVNYSEQIKHVVNDWLIQ